MSARRRIDGADRSTGPIGLGARLLVALRRSGAARRRGISTAAAALLVSTALVAQSGVTTNASWADAEWTRTPAVGTVDCDAADGAFATRGEGRALSGALLGMDLDSIAEASGVEVTNNGSRSQETRSVATSLGNDAYANPLDVTALSAVDVDLGQGMLHLPLDNSTGALGQYGQAKSDGLSVGASGYVTNTGGIATAPGNAYPDLASLSLSQLLGSINPGVAASISNVANLELATGAVAGRAHLDGCAAAWAADPAQAITREYLVSSLSTSFTSSTVTALRTEVLSAINGLQPTVNALVGSQGLLQSITGPLVTNLTSVLAGPGGSGLVRIDGTQTTITATVNTSPLMTALNAPIGNDIVTIDLASGRITTDFAALLAEAYPGVYGAGLNEQPPNTNLLADPMVMQTFTNAVADALTAWLDHVEGILDATVDAIDLVVNVKVNLGVRVQIFPLVDQWISIGAIEAQVAGTLAQVLNGQATVTASLVLLAGLGSIPIVGSVLVGLINGTLSPVLTLLTNTVKNVLGGIVAVALAGVFDGLRQLPPAVDNAAGAIGALVSGLYNNLFLNGVVSLLVNAQNDPLPGSPTPGPEPPDWTGLPEGRYDVAALRIGVLGALPSNDVRLYFGRGSVGSVCTMTEIAEGGCAGY